MSGRTDTERLRWMARLSDFFFEVDDDRYYRVRARGRNYSGRKLHDAIDAAMDAEERG
ncbi:hypothetical protein [Gluconobacter cerinus]|uniref:Uncharacterized protein n=1 Tax=Gluconobacter cerinus TaxID=38307 RepID=A0A1B6VKI4_9PROT|nr:hypothetical protein [Gluconobacter cerinus]OAJ67732.1 hypothetical protein A0123_01774 [Gluconobacter cerinus]